MSNKEIATSFLKAAAFGDVDTAYQKYVSPDFKHHNQWFKGDRASLLQGMKEASVSDPNTAFEVKKIVEEGNLVVTYSFVSTKDMGIAVFHMFRIEGGKIVEMWDVGQKIEENGPNENGLF